MFNSGIDVITIIVLILSCLAVVSKRKESEKPVVPRPWIEDLPSDYDEQELVLKKKPSDMPKPTGNVVKEKSNIAPPVTQEKSRGLDVDKKKLIIYSEILKPKFDE